MNSRRIRLATFGAAVVALLSPFALASSPAHAAGPQLASFDYIGAPYARVGWAEHDIATVSLSAPAVSDTVVTLSSTNTSVATVHSTVTVPAGQSTAAVPVTALSTGNARLSAMLDTTLILSPDLVVGSSDQVPVLSTLTVEPAHVQPGDPATGTVVLDFLAPPGGFVVNLSSDNAQVQVPPQVVVPEDSDRAPFGITTTTGPPVVGTVSATDGTVTRTDTLEVADTIAPQTTIAKVTVRQATHQAIVRFTSSEAGSIFLCRRDSGSYRACTSPVTYRHLATGRHTMRVKAIDPAGNPDPTPAVARFRITQ